MGESPIGDWIGSIYAMSGERGDWHLFLDHDGRYESSASLDEGEPKVTGQWEYDEEHRLLHLRPDGSADRDRRYASWRVLSVTTCEDTNLVLVLRKLILASRNLPILMYRVHGRGLG